MNVKTFLSILGADFYTGVPDSQLKAVCNYLMYTYGIDSKHHIIAANEGNCTAIATGYYLATGRVPVVYMQNSGEGNVINPIASLLNNKVYAIPMIFVIGWRGQPGVHDEPQHIYQGEITIKLLEDMDISVFVISKESTYKDVKVAMDEFLLKLSEGKQVAFVVEKGSLTFDGEMDYKNDNSMIREEIIKHITAVTGDDVIISTTGKTSRELFEIRESYAKNNDVNKKNIHCRDFMMVGSMGHCSSVALGVALNKPEKKVWCIDGDGSALMHMGAMPVISSCRPKNLIHIVINNGAHESVGGQPTVMSEIDFWKIAEDCGYPYAVCVSDYDSLDCEIEVAKNRNDLTFIEVKCAIGARDDLGRPTTTTIKNKEDFMLYLNSSQISK